MVNFDKFLKLEACSQTVLPDKSILIGQILAENVKIEKFKCDILSNFHTMSINLNVQHVNGLTHFDLD